MSELKLGFYRHYKGQLYQLIGTATHSETYQQMALYIPQYGDRGYWVRPLPMFQESVTIEGVQIPRFEYVEPQPTADLATQQTLNSGYQHD